MPKLHGNTSSTSTKVTYSGNMTLPITTMSTQVAHNSFTGSQGDNMSSIEKALQTLKNAGFSVPENIPVQENEDLQPDYESVNANLSVSNQLDFILPLDSLRDDIRLRHPNMPVPQVIPQTKPTPLGLGLYAKQESAVNSNLPLSPALSQWLEFHSSILEGKGHLGRSKVQSYLKGQYPKLPTISSNRYLPPDANKLYEAPTLPESWYKVCGSQASSTPGAFSFSHRELEEQIGCAGRDISVISDLEWLTEGASGLVNEMATKPELATSLTHQTFLQKYLLEICRGVQALGLSSSARYANLIWHMRDSYLSKLHPAIPKATRDVLRRSPLNSGHLFTEATVATAAANLTGDLQLQTNARALQRLQAPVTFPRGKGKRPPGQQVRMPQAPKKPRFEQPGSFQNPGAGRGWRPRGESQFPRKSYRGRGRGKPK